MLWVSNLPLTHVSFSCSSHIARIQLGVSIALLACRVKELESLQSQVAQNHGKEMVDEQALQEMEMMRQRVMHLEGEATSRAEGADQAAADAGLAELNAELMEEMDEVRRRVMELQVCVLTYAPSVCRMNRLSSAPNSKMQDSGRTAVQVAFCKTTNSCLYNHWDANSQRLVISVQLNTRIIHEASYQP